MASFEGNKIKDTYKSILKVSDNGELEATEQEITDGAGNGTGVKLNNQGDVTADGTVAFGSLKDSGEDITVTKFVDEADGIANNDNDTSIPTSAAVRDYVDSNVTAQDLDITDGTNVGSVDLDSEALTFTGDAGVSATVSGQTVTIDSSALQSQITANDGDISTLQSDLATEESARASADSALQSQITSNDGDIFALDVRVTAAEADIVSNDGDISGLNTRLNTAENKLATVEVGAEVNPDAAEVKSLYESNADTNAFTNALQTKLAGIEEGAEVNPTATETKTAYESNANTNAFTDAEKTKLASVESGAQVNTVTSVNSATGAVVLDADDISDSTTTNKFISQAEIDKLAGIEAGAQVNTVDSVNGATGTVVLDTDDVSEGSNLYYTDARANSAIDTRVTKSYVEALDLNIDADKVVFAASGDWDPSITNAQAALDDLQLNKANLADLPSNLSIFPTTASSDISGYFTLATSTTDAAYDTTAVNAPTGTISGTDQLVSSSATAANVLTGDTGLINVTFISEIRKVNGNPNNAFFYFELYKRNGAGTETLLATSSPTAEVVSTDYQEFYSSALIENASFIDSDRLVLKFYGTSVGTGTDASFEARLGGTAPTRGLLPVPFGAVPVDNSASISQTDTSNFNNILSSADDTVQKALDTIDDMTLSSISDVSSSAATDGQVLTYNQTSGEWQPAAPGAAPVDSVNGQTGVVVLDADDIDDAATTNKFVTSTEVTKLGNISITQPVDLDTVESDLSGVKTKTDFITITENVNLDTIKADTATNNAKISFDSASSSKLAGIEAGAQVNTVDSVNGLGGAVVLDADDIDDATTTNKFASSAQLDKVDAITDTGSGNIISDAERTKLAGIETGADVTDTTNVVASLTAGSNITIAANGTISATDTNTTYTAGSGISIVGDTISNTITNNNQLINGAGYATEGYVTTAVSGAIFTDSDASLNSLTTGGLSVDTGAVFDGGIDSIGQTGDTYSIRTDNAGSLFITNNSIGGSAFEVNNDYIKFINGSSGSALTLRERAIGGAGFSISNTSGYSCNDDGGGYPDATGWVRLNSTNSVFRTNKNNSFADNSSKVYIKQFPDNGSATIEHEGINPNAIFKIRTNETLELSSGNDINLIATSGQGTVNIQGDLGVDGIIQATGDVVAFSSSDKRLKDNIEQIPNAIDKIQSIGGYSFDWNDKQDTYKVGSRDIGVVAQEIEEVLPELVITRDNGYKAVKYEKIVALLIEGIKEQQEQINELKTKLDGITN